jgi:hypothetical protein
MVGGKKIKGVSDWRMELDCARGIMRIKFKNVWMCMEDGNEGCLGLEDGTGLSAEGEWQYESVYGGWEI